MIQGNDRRWIQLEQVVVQLDDICPIRRCEIGGVRVDSGDAGLQMIHADYTAASAAVQPEHALADPPAVPERAILLLQQKQIAGRIDARRGTSRLQQREGGESLSFRTTCSL